MNLILDFGNTSAKAGIFNGHELITVHDRLGLADIAGIISKTDPEYVFASSVSISKDQIREQLPRPVRFLEQTTPLPFRNDYRTPETLGLDRIAGVAGAQELFPDQGALVIDIGTCITYDVITADGIYMGGAISPGVDLRFRAMHEYTAGLPLITPDEEPALTGKSTKGSMLSGVIFGVTAEIEGFIQHYCDEYGDLKIILCGGGSKIFENRLKQAIFAAPNLVLRGLNRILLYNVA